MTADQGNIDDREIRYFENHAGDWWNPDGPLKPLHAINPLRLRYILDRSSVTDKSVLDIGCGGGILAEAMAKEGARVTGIDMAESALAAARKHKPPDLPIDYLSGSAENLAGKMPGSFDIICCMELLEHIPDPPSMLRCCKRLINPAGDIFVSTVSRTPLSWLLVIFAAENVLGIVKKGTHEYRKFIHPARLEKWARNAGLEVQDCSGFIYLPVVNRARLWKKFRVNYLMHLKPASSGPAECF